MTELLYRQLQDRLSLDVAGFLPELVLCGSIVLLLLIRMFLGNRTNLGLLGLIFVGVTLAVTLAQWNGIAGYDPRVGVNDRPSIELFGGMLVFDNFTIWIKLFLVVFLGGMIVLCMLTGIPDREDSADFLTLLFGATVGMMLMASANHLLMVFLAIEMASLPSYALAGFLKGRRSSSEAALKYVVYGGGAAGVMLYGISLLAGKFGTAYLPDLLRLVAQSLLAGPQLDLLVIMGLLFLLVGVAFKLSAVPFHFWCPDVFEGAAAEIGAFLSIASKGAALALLARLVMPLRELPELLVPALTILAVVTMTFGNLAAYGQTNLKRLLAYSTIAHAGFMIAGFATLNQVGVEAVLFYLATYLLMNLGAFAVVAFLRNATGSEDLADFRGLVFRAPLLVIALGVFMLSLVGLPPLAGFVAKFQIFRALFVGARAAGSDVVSYSLYGLVLVGGLNTVLSLFYYVKVLKVMILEQPVEQVEGREATPVRVGELQAVYVVVLAVLVLIGGIYWGPIATSTVKGAVTAELRENR